MCGSHVVCLFKGTQQQIWALHKCLDSVNIWFLNCLINIFFYITTGIPLNTQYKLLASCNA